MTTTQKPLQSADGQAATGGGDQAVRHTEVWEHETFAEEQARWERSDPDYARICEAVRQAARDGDEEALRLAEQTKGEWDARVATQRDANDDAQRARHALNHAPRGAVR